MTGVTGSYFERGEYYCTLNMVVLKAFISSVISFSLKRKFIYFHLSGEELGHSAKTHINFTNNGKCSPLHLAVQSGDLEMIKMCIEFGAQIDLKQVKFRLEQNVFLIKPMYL